MDTIYALSSGRPPAAVAVIRVSGSRAHHAARLLAGELPAARVATLRTLRDPATNGLLDRALMLRFDQPASATGENLVEFHCHGGRAIVDGLCSALAGVDGLREAQPGEFTRRAFENGRIDLTEAEGLADLLEAETQSQRKAALLVAEGGLRKQVNFWREQLLALSAAAERAIDFDEDDDAIDAQLTRGCQALADELGQWLGRPALEPLKDGVRVVVAGLPNVGKSSLINAIVGDERAIVTSVAGTTRDHIDVPLSLRGLPILLTDTAGLRDTADAVEALGVARSRTLVEAADILVWLGETRDAPAHPRLIKVHAKSDLAGREPTPLGSIAISSLTGAGVGDLLERISELVGTHLPDEGAIALNRRQAGHLREAAETLADAAGSSDVVLVAESLRAARAAFDRLTGRAGVEDVLDALFARFCLGK